MRLSFRSVWSLITPYWRSRENKIAVMLLVSVVGLNLGEVYINVLLNKWNNDFYNSLQVVDKDAFFKSLLRFSWLVCSAVAIGVYKIYLNQMLQIRWRRWLTADMLHRWLNNHSHYRMRLQGQSSDNPDQRISDDIDQFISLTLGLSLGLISAVVTLCSFLTMLWGLSGALAIPLGQFGVLDVPGYLVWTAMLYAIAGTYFTTKIGKPLIGLNFDQQHYEANFRFALVRFRENSEPIAFYSGEPVELRTFLIRFGDVVNNTLGIMRRQKKLTWFTSFYYQLAIIFPFVVAAPRFFAKQIQMGGLMQTASAFRQVQESFSYVISAYNSIAVWQAVVQRLVGFEADMRKAEQTVKDPAVFKPSRVAGQNLTARHLSISLPNGTSLARDLNLTIAVGDTVLIKGPSGSGKSTLLRTLAGLWPFADGELNIPTDAHLLFLPQQPYLPLGSLRHVLTYPGRATHSDAELQDALRVCHLEKFMNRLGEDAQWAHIMSPGEQQRLSFARALLTQPDFLFLDEATSALDETNEHALYGLLRNMLPNTAVISVGHRNTLEQWHEKRVDLSA